MVKIPQEYKWSQANTGDIFGILYGTYNIDLTSKKGKLRISPRLLKNVDEDDLANLGIPSAFTINTQSTVPVAYIWALCGARAFYSPGGLDTAFQQDGTAGTPTNLSSDTSDICNAFGKMFTSQTNSTMKYLSGAVWSSFSCGNGGGVGQMVKFGSRVYKIDNTNKDIISWDSSLTVASAGSQYTLQSLCDGSNDAIAWITATSNRIYIGTISFNGDPGKVYGWDGSQTTVNETYILNDAGALAGCVKDNAPWIFDVSGRLQGFNGGTFEEKARLFLDNAFLGTLGGTATTRPVHFNGMKVIDGNIRILINTQLWDTKGTIRENTPSGVYEYTPENGLYHVNSPTIRKAGETIVDYGQQRIAGVGAIAPAKFNSQNLTAGATDGSYLVGLQYYSDATTTKKAIFYDNFNDDMYKIGSFITEKIHSSNISDFFNTLWSRYNFPETADVRIKYRLIEEEPYQNTITWVGSNVFSIANDFPYAVNDEIEFIQGKYAGYITKITAIEDAGALLYITVEDTFTVTGGDTAIVRANSWKELEDFSSVTGTIVQESTFGENDDGVWVQLKMWIGTTGKGELIDMSLINKADQEAV